MPVATRRRNLEALRHRLHARCLLCGEENAHGFKLCFHPSPEGGVEAVFACRKMHEGYPDQLHGGVIASLLDSAMTNCLFSHGVEARTAELNVRYHHPVDVHQPIVLRAVKASGRGRLHHLRAELSQAGRIRASAEAKFISGVGAPGTAGGTA